MTAAAFDVTFGGTLSGDLEPRMTLRPAGTLSGDDGAPAGATAEESVAAEDFVIEDTVGRGGMGIIFRARQRSLDRIVAIKVLRPELRGGPAAEKFATEAFVTARLDHPSIPPVHAYGRDPSGNPYLAMKLVRGLEWAELLDPKTDEARARAARMDLREHLEILGRVCEAVAYAHSHGIIHRDLKPENVMVGEFGEVLVMDWGVALDVSSTGPATGASGGAKAGVRRPVGTPAYMAPEMAKCREEEIGPATDVYLLGGILYEILTGTPPHRGEGIFDVILAAASGEVEPPEKRAPHRKIPPALAEIAMRALDPVPARRFQSSMELSRAIDEFWRHESSTALSDFALAELSDVEVAIAARRGTPGEIYGRLAGAVAALKQAEELWPGNRAAKYAIGRARVVYAGYALENGDLALAAAQVDLAGRDAPGVEAVALRLAAAHAARAAEATRRRRLLYGLGGALVLVVLAIILAVRQAMRANEAEERKRRREQAQAEIDLMTWAEDDGKVKAYERALAIDPDWPEGLASLGRARMELASTLIYTPNYDPGGSEAELLKAAAAQDRSLELNPDDLLTNSDRAYVASMLGDWPTARKYYERTARIDPRSHAGLEALGLIALDDGRLAEAEAFFTKTIELDPQQMDYVQRAVVRYTLGDMEGALADALKVEGLDAREEWYIALVALVRLGRGELLEAGHKLAFGLQLYPEGPHLLPLLAWRAARLGDRSRAEALLAKARDSHARRRRSFLGVHPHWSVMTKAPVPRDAPVRAVLLDLDIEKTLPPAPAESIGIRQRGERLLEDGRFEAALAAATRALAEDPADGAARLLRGRALAAFGHYGPARIDLAVVPVLAPERAADAARALEELERAEKEARGAEPPIPVPPPAILSPRPPGAGQAGRDRPPERGSPPPPPPGDGSQP